MTEKDTPLTRTDGSRTGRGFRRGFWLLALAFVALVAGAALWLIDGGIPLPEDGTTIATSAHGQPVFVRRDGNDVKAYVADPQHLPDETLWWCESEDAFYGPAHGELFDSDGVAVAGPGRRNLDRLPVAVDGETIRIRGDVLQGAPRDRSRDVHNLADALGQDAAATYRHDPAAFCPDRLTAAESTRGWWDRLRETIRNVASGGDHPAHP